LHVQPPFLPSGSVIEPWPARIFVLSFIPGRPFQAWQIWNCALAVRVDAEATACVDSGLDLHFDSPLSSSTIEVRL
jgi:hypothetical protein